MSDLQTNKRFILLLNRSDKTSLKSLEKDFKVSILSSENLNEDNRAFNILSSKNSILYKNLDAVVMDNVDIKQLNKSLKNTKSPLIYFEEDKEFKAFDEIEIINDLKETTNLLRKKIDDLEEIIETKTKNLPYTDMEWGLKTIGIQNTQDTGKGVDICVLDTGFDVNHPDFTNRMIEGKSFVSGEEWNTDLNGHGTHCAGTAAGDKRLDTGKRYGVAPDANLKIAKVFGKSGTGTTSAIVDAIDWAITKKYRVISMSLGAPVEINEPPSHIFEMVGKKALDQNCLIISASGNDSNRPSMPRPVSSPANSKSIMAVAAVDEQLQVAKFSNAGINAADGGEVNICAPGVSILSAYPKHKNNYAFKSGTSMATPHVSGLAALYMQAFPNLKAKQIWNKLEGHAKKIENAKYRDLGNGLAQTLSNNV